MLPTIKTNTDVLPKHTLSEPGWLGFAELEQELDKQLIATLVAAGQAVDPVNGAEVAMRSGASLVLARPNAFGLATFDIGIQRDSMLPAVLHVCLKRHHPELSRARATALITDENRAAVRAACLDLLGYGPNPTGGATQTGTQSEAPSTSAGSSEPFGKPASPGQTSTT